MIVWHMTTALLECALFRINVLYIAVDDFREVSQLMLHTHQFNGQQSRAGDQGGRVEFLPVHWHETLHCADTGVDR